MWLFIDLSNWSKISGLLKIYLGKFCQKCFFYFSQLLLTSSFLTNVILVKLKILCILMQWSKWFIFWNVFILQIISFLELFSAICFLCILQTHLTRRNTSIPKKLKKRKLTTFMMASSNDGKSDIYQFFYPDLSHIVNTVYVQNIM